MSSRPRDGAERLLVIATVGLPAHRCEWGAAMRAELASIDDSEARRRFARSAARAVVGQCLGIRVGCGLVTGVLVAAVAVTASRLQLADGGPGLLDVTVPVPAFLLMLVALVSAGLTRSFRVGLETGVYAMVAGFAALFVVLAVEGMVWMDRHGVFVLDGDPARGVVGTADVVFNIFSTGMWAGHVIVWVPGVLIGAALGALTGRQQGISGVR